MSDNISIRGPGPTYLGGISTGERTPQKTRPTPEGTPPPKINLDTGPDSIPKLDLPTMQIDALGDVADKFLALKLKTSDQQLAGSMKDVQDRGAVMKSKNADISNKLNEAAQKIAEAEKAQAAMKALSWIAVALSILFAIFTGGVGAIVGAAVATTMAVLNETGVMTKLTDAIAKGLEGTGDPPMSSELAKEMGPGHHDGHHARRVGCHGCDQPRHQRNAVRRPGEQAAADRRYNCGEDRHRRYRGNRAYHG